MKNKTFRIFTMGCKVNQYESQAIREQLERVGFREVKPSQKADTYIINTCTVTSTADRKSRNLIRRSKRENSKAIVLVTGCYAQSQAEDIRKIEGVDYVVSNEEKKVIAKYVTKNRISSNINDFGISRFDGHTRAFVKIQDGCNNFCSFCKIPYVRGRSRSRKAVDIIKEIKKLGDNGFREVVLTGICLGDYGKDLPTKIDLVDLIEEIEKIDRIWRIRLSSIEAKDINERLIERMKNSKKLCHHLHIPFQSGDNRVLQLMNRSLSREDYLKLVKKLKKEIRNIAITCDIMIGFPNEDEKAFSNTLDLLKKIIPAKVHIFVFTPREQTPLSQVPTDKKTMDIRYLKLKKLSEKLAMEYMKRFLNKNIHVLFEGIKDGLWQGHSSNYLLIFIKEMKKIRNKLVLVRPFDLCRNGLISRLAKN